MTFTAAMARREGFGPAGTRATRNNNPLNMEWGPFTRRYGATRVEVMPEESKRKPRFAYFPTAKDGMAAAVALLNVPAKFDKDGKHVGGYMGATIREVITRWAPPEENDTEGYIRDVCAFSGLPDTTVLTPALL